MGKYNKGDEVSWAWGEGRARGTIKEKFKEKVTRTLQGSEVTRNGTKDNPAYLIEQENGTELLKLRSELNEG